MTWNRDPHPQQLLPPAAPQYPSPQYQSRQYQSPQYWGQPQLVAQPPQPDQPAQPRLAAARPGAVVPLMVIVVLLGLGLAGTGASWLIRTSSAHERISQLKKEHAGYVKTKADQASARAARLAAADLAGKFEAVRTANSKLTAEVTAWDIRPSAQKISTIHTSQELRSACLEAVIAYNVAAAPFESAELGDLPTEIDMSDDQFNCLVKDWASV